MGHIYLVGFMGVGKSTVGRALAERLGRPFADLDAEIETRCGRAPGAVIRQEGESAFRDRETEALRGLAAAEDPLVVACGGGAVLRDANIALMRASGAVVWLRASAATCRSRAEGGADRPLLGDVAEAERLLRERAGRYALAGITVETDGLSAAETVEAIVREIGAGDA